MPTCNGHEVSAGCYIAGHWGQYGPDHLADRAAEFGWEPAKWSDDPRAIRDVIDTIESWGYPRQPADFTTSEAVAIIGFLWDAHTEAADDIETWLNDHTPDWGIYWMWSDGEFYLSGIDENGDPEWD